MQSISKISGLFYKQLLAAVLLVAFSFNSFAGITPVQEWDKTFGGLKDEGLTYLQQTSDGGFILGGNSNSDAGEQKSSNAVGDADYWIIKTDASGNKLWEKTFGGAGLETFQMLQQTKDGGYILGGSSQSDAGQAKSQPGLGNYDFWVIKLDASGNKIWDKTFGDQGYDFLHSVAQTVDGGYILGGVSFQKSLEANAAEMAPEPHYLLVKLDDAGNKIWTKAINNIDADAAEPFVMHQTPDNGFILAGSFYSASLSGSDLAGKGASDFHLIKLNAHGNREWEKLYGGNNDEFLSGLQLTQDGGFILGGISHSGKSHDKSESNNGKGDFWVIKVNARGEKVWDKTFGGSDYDYLSALQVTEDGGYLLGGTSRSGKSGDKSQANYGKTDFWVVKLDANGSKSWEQAYGGAKDDELYTLTQTLDGGVLLGGSSNSEAQTGKAEPNIGGKDIWVIKLKAPALSWYSF